MLFWSISAVVLAVVLLGAWLYDRRYGVDQTRMPSALDRAKAGADASVTERQAGITGS